MEQTNFTTEQLAYIESQKLSPDELEANIQKVIAVSKVGKTVSDRPIAFIVGGQPGSGKSGIIGHIFENYGNNFVLVDNDEYRKHHPNVHEINEWHPEIYTECTDQLSFAATPRVIDAMISQRYNMVIHQTLKNDTIIRCAIADLTKAGYVVVVNVMAADKITSLYGELSRGQKQLGVDGTCRWVPPKNHDEAYNGLPDTVKKIEEKGCYDLIEVMTRSDDPNEPTKVNIIYRKRNPEISSDHLMTLAEYGLTLPQITQFETARQAVVEGREQDADKMLEKIEGKLEEAESLPDKQKREITPEEMSRILRLRGIGVEYAAQKAAKGNKKD